MLEDWLNPQKRRVNMAKYPFLDYISGVYIDCLEGYKIARNLARKGELFLGVSEDMMDEIVAHLQDNACFSLKVFTELGIENLLFTSNVQCDETNDER